MTGRAGRSGSATAVRRGVLALAVVTCLAAALTAGPPVVSPVSADPEPTQEQAPESEPSCPGCYGEATHGRSLPDAPVAAESPDPRFVVDHHGRVVLLRGMNVISAAKHDPEHTGGVDEAMIARLPADFGFNVARHLIFWQAIEPTQGVYDDAYLDRVRQRLDWYAAHGVYVVLDMHQDVYGPAFGGNGAPEWATITDGLVFTPLPPGAPWWLAVADPAVQAAYRNFWDPERGHGHLQDHYVAAWQEVARRFADHPAVIGYDIMNEPGWAQGDLTQTIEFAKLAAETGNWRNEKLIAFTQRVVDAIRVEDADGWIGFEPSSVVQVDIDLGDGLVGPFPGDLGPIGDPRPGAPRLLYAPHLYPTELHEGGAYPEGEPYVGQWEALRSADRDRFGGALFLGEFGAGPPTPLEDLGRFFDDVLSMADRQLAGWAYWSYDPGWWGITNPDGTEAAHASFVVRPYPQAVAGTPTLFRHDPATKVTRLRFVPDASIDAPTELYLALARHYPDGYAVTISGGTAGWDLDADAEVLLVGDAQAAGELEICVTPAGEACPPLDEGVPTPVTPAPAVATAPRFTG